MKLSELPKLIKIKKRRLGQGHGSGRGKTGGRGTKGTNARGKVALSFEGGALPLIKRMPFHRGKGKNKSIKRVHPVIINLSSLALLPKNTVVDVGLLIKKGIVSEKEVKASGIKLLGNGTITGPLTIKLPLSQSAKLKIEQAGGKVENLSHE